MKNFLNKTINFFEDYGIIFVMALFSVVFASLIF